MKRSVWAIAISLSAFLSAQSMAAIRYVKVGAAGANNGTSWTDAYSGVAGLQSALSAAVAGDEVWVSVGSYEPTATADRTATLQLRNNIAIYGGFRGLPGDEGINDATTRPPDPAPTTANPASDSILTGDLSGNDGPNFANSADNSLHVVTGTSTNSSAGLIGFTIIAGNANGAVTDRTGGGIYNASGGSPAITDCVILRNQSIGDAGGVHNVSGNASYTNCIFDGNRSQSGGACLNFGGTPSFVNCSFTNNLATHVTFGGGAVYNQSSAASIFRNCTFQNNSADQHGGAVYVDASSPQFLKCTFLSNASDDHGGGIYVVGNSGPIITACRFLSNTAGEQGGGILINTSAGPALIVNCVFQGNTAEEFGGAVDAESGAVLTVSNCLLLSNSAGFGGGGVYNSDGFATVLNSTLLNNSAGNLLGGGIHGRNNSTTNVRNSIIWYNTNAGASSEAQVHSESGASINRTYSNVQGLGNGTGNISAEPNFVTPGDPDGTDNLFGTSDDGYRLAPTSPSIDAGRNSDTLTDDDFDVDGDGNTAEPAMDLALQARFGDSTHRCDSGNGTAPIVDMGPYENDGLWATPHRVYVRAQASGGNNGATWTDALASLQTAMAVVDAFRVACPAQAFEIWVARSASNPSYPPATNTDRTVSYSLRNNLTLYGGFAGNETLLSQRNLSLPTVLDGDIGTLNDFSDNSYHIISGGAGINSSSALDGFQLQYAWANAAAPNDRGAGLYLTGGASPRIANCNLYILTANSSGAAGYIDGSPRILNCTLYGNGSVNGGGFNFVSGNSLLSRVIFHTNNATNEGGGVCVSGGNPRLYNCSWRYNTSSVGGAAIAVLSGSVYAANGLILRNAAPYGAGIDNFGTTNLTNCTVTDNRLTYLDCAACGGAGIYNTGGNVTLNNTILWNNRALSSSLQINQFASSGGTLLANRSCIQGFGSGSIPGTGTISLDPRLEDPVGPDFFPGSYRPRLLSVSPCIDRGGNTAINDAADPADLDGDTDITEPLPLDLDNTPRRYDAPGVLDVGKGTEPIADMGAYEFGAASPDVCNGGLCLGDLNHDGLINGLDVPLYVQLLLTTTGVCP